MDTIERNLLLQVADMDGVPEGAYNIRSNGKLAGRQSTANIEITSKEDKPGIDIHIKPGTKHESMHIPVVMTESGMNDLVYNDFYVGEDADVLIIAGCGINNCGHQTSQHDGIHTFWVGKNARVKYVEKHYGEGEGDGARVLNPETVIHLSENSYMEMVSVQIKGVDSTVRNTVGDLADGATLIISEKIMTHENQVAETNFTVDMNGVDCHADVVSRSVARGNSKQIFNSSINGNKRCTGHSECDAIIMDSAHVVARPALEANDLDASLIHEAAIGKIAGEQIIKLETLGLTEQEAEEQIISGFLK
ncbi:MAG: SufD family Fe-S cluster assembly protein [Lachnospiraceae bacterium]|nr:SufD family Fe-S cluster assembly protein [Lachnospiraceae bacterium]